MNVNYKNIHLYISLVIVVLAALIYGFYPDLILDIQLNTVDEHNAFKGIMMLYLGFSALWVIGLFKSNHFKTALVTNIIFMLGLASGRLISLILDGIPSSVYLFGVFGKLILGLYGIWVLNRITLK